MLGLPGQHRDLDVVEARVGQGQQGLGGGDFEGGRGRHAAANGHIRLDQQIPGSQGDALSGKQNRHAEHVIAPGRSEGWRFRRRRGQLRQLDGRGFAHGGRMRDQSGVSPGAGRDVNGRCNRHGQDESVVVIRVLSEQAHSPRRSRPYGRSGVVKNDPEVGTQ